MTLRDARWRTGLQAGYMHDARALRVLPAPCCAGDAPLLVIATGCPADELTDAERDALLEEHGYRRLGPWGHGTIGSGCAVERCC